MVKFVYQIEVIVGKLFCHLQPADGFHTACNVYSLYDVNVLPSFPAASDMAPGIVDNKKICFCYHLSLYILS